MVKAPSLKTDPLYLLEARRICIIKPSALGDVVQTLPLLPMLKERFPRAEISWVINSQFASLLEGHPALDHVIPFDRQGGWSAWPPLLKDLRRRNFDLVFDLQGLFRTAMMTWATGAPVRIGLETARELSHLSCHQLIPDSGKQVPAYNRVWRVAEALGMGSLGRETVIAIREEDRRKVNQQLSRLTRPFLAIQPGAQWLTKRWPVEKFAEVAVKAARMLELDIVLIGAPSERPLAQQLQLQIQTEKQDARVVNLAGETSLKQLAALMERAEILLTNDSGPMHLAAGLKVPLVGVFTSTSARRSGPPPSPLTRLVSTESACQACYKKRCPKSGTAHLACQQGLEVDRVWEAVHQLHFRLQSRAA